MAGNISATTLYEAALTLEKMIMAGATPFDQPLAVFETALDQVLTTIQAMQQDPAIATHSSIPLDKEQIAPLLQTLAEDLKERRFETQATFEMIQPLFASVEGEMQQRFTTLAAEINRLDFDTAYRSLMSIITYLDIKIFLQQSI